MSKENLLWGIFFIILLAAAFRLGRYSKQCPQPNPIIRYIETKAQIKKIQYEIDSIDVLIRTDHVTMPRSKRDSLRKHFNP